jgi:hypothetical protein
VISGTPEAAGTPNIPQFLTNPQLSGGVTGQIGDVRVGGNATNFSTLVYDATGTGGAKLSNFSVGGETNNVLIVAPNSARNLYFGKGMDTVDVASNVINTIKANRGALNSTVFTDRTISRLQFGGDVANSDFLSGYQQSYTTIINDVTGQGSVSVFNPTPSPVPLPFPLNAQTGGGMTVLVAGNVIDSVFAASTEPGITPQNTPSATTPVFGTSGDLRLPGGHISEKVEGTINNSSATPASPTKAFYAKTVLVNSGPVIPPNVPQPPYGGPKRPTHAPGLHHPLTKDNIQKANTVVNSRNT